jgi:hypothetical protein
MIVFIVPPEGPLRTGKLSRYILILENVALKLKVEELIRVILKYADQHPEHLHWQSVQFVTEALRNAYPCPVS